MTGLFAENGPVSYFMFLAENKCSFSFLLIVFYLFSSLDSSLTGARTTCSAAARRLASSSGR